MATGMNGSPAANGIQIDQKLMALGRMNLSGLRTEWRRLFRSHPPKHARGDLLLLAIAWKIQEKAWGGLTAAEKRRLDRIAKDLKVPGQQLKNSTIRVKAGSSLVREWRGKTHEVLALENGFEWRGQRWRSLSAIARAITGTPWSGPRFFGLQSKPEPLRSEEQGDG